MSTTLLKPRPDDVTQVWECEIDGTPVPARHVRLHSRFGIVECGVGVEDYHRILFREPGYGGSVVHLHLLADNIVYLLVIDMDRSDTMGEQLCSPGMFVFDDKAHLEVGNTITAKELGLSPADFQLHLIGVVNPNRAYLDTPKGEGVHHYGCQVANHLVTKNENGTYVFKEGVAQTPDAGLQKIKEMKFLPWFDVAKLQDGFAQTGVAQTLAYLLENGLIKVELTSPD